MGGTTYPLCHVCGYKSLQFPGRKCTQPRWHKPPKAVSRTDCRTWSEKNATHQSGQVQGWVRARIAVEAQKKGVSPTYLAGLILTSWSRRRGGFT
jgi:hypothetical protein